MLVVVMVVVVGVLVVGLTIFLGKKYIYIYMPPNVFLPTKYISYTVPSTIIRKLGEQCFLDTVCPINLHKLV